MCLRTSREKEESLAVHRVRRSSSSFGFPASLYLFFRALFCYFEPKLRREELQLGGGVKVKDLQPSFLRPA